MIPDVEHPTARRLRTRAWKRRWFPRVRILAPIVALGVVALVIVLVRTTVPMSSPAPLPEDAATMEASRLDEQGLAQISQVQTVVFDVRTMPASAEALGVDDGEIEVVTQASPVETILLLPRDEVLRGPMRSVVVTIESGALASIDTTREPWGFGDFNLIRAALADGVAIYGWRYDSQIEQQLLDDVADAVRNGRPTQVDIQAGTAAGIPIGASVECDDAGQCYIHYVITQS